MFRILPGAAPAFSPAYDAAHAAEVVRAARAACATARGLCAAAGA